jgi:hypothetical protein
MLSKNGYADVFGNQKGALTIEWEYRQIFGKVSLGETKDAEGNKAEVKETKFIKGKDVGESDKIPEELLGPTTKGTCTEVHFKIPLINHNHKLFDFGECYDYRNALCKDSKCRCLKGQKLSEDGEYCIDDDVCTKHLTIPCGKILGVFGGTCPDWSGAKCVNDQCVCREDSDKPCATQVTGYWAWKDTIAKCGPKKGTQTCLKNTQGTCLISYANNVALKKIAGKVPIVGKVIAGAAKKHVLSKIPGNVFGDKGNCFDWRDAICAPLVLPSAMGVVGDKITAASKVIDNPLGTMCVCRPTDCAVWSKKHKGYTCVYSSLLKLDDEVTEDFEVLTGKVYNNITRAWGGRGRDDPAEFFDIRRELLRQYPEHATCISSMRLGSSEMTPECKEFLCEFARTTTGSFDLATKECRLNGDVSVLVHVVPGAFLAISLLAMGLVAYRRVAQRVVADSKNMLMPVADEEFNLNDQQDLE